MLRATTAAVFVVLLTLSPFNIGAQTHPPTQEEKRKDTMSSHAKGPFEVKLTPQDDKTADSLSRLTIDKQFHGDLAATSKGTMLSATTATKGSAGYVALELVSGSLNGRAGTFVLQHTGTMDRGAPSLSITVVPDSGTGQLIGLTGAMAINIVDGKHSYDLTYTLPVTQ
jgi:uncharacterized protein DUF3224